MLKELIVEATSKRSARRVLSIDPPSTEVSFEESGHILGVPATGVGTYTATIRPDGSIFGHGQGLETTQDGDAITWSGTGVGHFGPGGSISYRGMLFFRTASQKLARINNACGAFEYEVDGTGAGVSKVWEWK